MADETDQGGLDTADTARRPQEVDPTDDLFAAMVAALRNHIFGEGEQGILRGLRAADEVGRVIGEMVFAMVLEAAHQAEAKGAELEWDMLIGVATEAIDDIVELAEADGITVSDQDRQYALLYAQQLYVDNQKPTEDQRNAARSELAALKQDGAVDEATAYVQKVGAENGADPFDVAGMSGGAGLMGGE